MEKKVIELTVSEDNETQVELISMVENPAIEVEFKYFSKVEKVERFKTTDEEKRIVTGPAMIPDERILRIDDKGEEYDVFFSEDTIRKCNEMYFKQGKNIGSNLEHETPIDGVTVVESWLIEDSKIDKAVALGFKDLPKGTWMVSYKIDNDEVLEKIKSGEILGFSVEGLFGEKEETFSLKDVRELLLSDLTDSEKLEIIKNKMHN